MSGRVVIDRRLCLTEDGKRVVPEGDPEARWLWAIPGQSVDREEAERLGAISPPTPEPKTSVEPPKKQAVSAATKAKLPEENK